VCRIRNCLLSAGGSEYMGNVSQSASGATCEPWNSTVLPRSQLAVINQISSVLGTTNGNECRNVNSQSRPWCYDNQQQVMYCNIPYCGNYAACAIKVGIDYILYK
jgi:hypothetical protein